jgi:hypothetical protein
LRRTRWSLIGWSVMATAGAILSHLSAGESLKEIPMRLFAASVFALATALFTTGLTGSALQDADRSVPGGGIHAPGWKGRIDPASAKQGRTINDSKFEQQGSTITLAVGPAAVYWNPANTASGNYSVKATFREPKFMSANNHPHPYGIFIAGSKMDTDSPTLLYCSPYGNGRILVRGFSNGTVFTPMARAENPAVHKAEPGAEVTQEVMWTVKDGRAECSVNGTVVAGYDKSEIVGEGKLESLDGVYGIRVSHNLDVVVTNFTSAKG